MFVPPVNGLSFSTEDSKEKLRLTENIQLIKMYSSSVTKVDSRAANGKLDRGLGASFGGYEKKNRAEENGLYFVHL